MRRKYPQDILDKTHELVQKDVEDWVAHEIRCNPNMSQFDVEYQRDYAKHYFAWYHEPHPTMSDDAIREYLGLPVKTQEEYVKEYLDKQSVGFNVGEVTGLDLVDRGAYYELVCSKLI